LSLLLHSHSGRAQAETPLMPLSKFVGPPLLVRTTMTSDSSSKSAPVNSSSWRSIIWVEIKRQGHLGHGARCDPRTGLIDASELAAEKRINRVGPDNICRKQIR
jgi:hypothetical protein